MRSVWTTGLLLGLLCMVGTGCKPTYPKCDSDTDCPGNKEGKEFCVNGQCQQCRPGTNDCGPGKECNAGRCDPIPNYCSRSQDCKNGGVCVNNRCQPCKGDGQCNGGRCNNGRCETEARTRCKSNDECKESEDCKDGFCTPANHTSFVPGGGGCGALSAHLERVDQVVVDAGLLVAERAALVGGGVGAGGIGHGARLSASRCAGPGGGRPVE